MFANGEPFVPRAILNSFSRTATHACCTAVPAEAAVHEPPSMGDLGRSLSPIRTRTRSGATPIVSAATCVRMV